MAYDNKEELRIRQINCAKQERSTALLTRWHKKNDITCIQEPNIKQLKILGKAGKLYKSESHRAPRAAVLIHNQFDTTKLPKFCNRDTATVLLEKHKLAISSVYCHKDLPVWSKLVQELILYCKRKNYKLILALDANAHSTVWGCKYDDRRGFNIEEACVRNNLTVCNQGDTCTYDDSIFRKKKVRKSIPDITITNCINLVTGWEVSDEPSLSDHKIITFSVQNIKRDKEPMRRNFKNTNWNDIADDISKIIPDTVPAYWSEHKLEVACRNLTTALRESLDIHAPMTPPAKRYEYWWNTECSSAKRKSLKAERKAKLKKTPQLRKIAREELRKYQKTCWQAKEKAWKQFISEVDDIPEMAKVTKIMRRLHEKDVELGLVKDEDGNLAETKLQSIQLMMTEHFPNCSTVESADKSGPPPNKTRLVQRRDFEWITTDRIRLAVHEFSPNKAPGIDEWRAEVLKCLDDKTVEYIRELFNASVSLHYVPLDWRRTYVKFLGKPGKSDYTMKNAFRPVSLMSVLFKTLERLSSWQIEETALTKKPFHRAQYAFRKGTGCENALSDIVNTIEKAVHKGEYCLTVNTDIAGAFNNVSYEAIITAMTKRGVNDDIIKWYKNFLTTRTCESELGEATVIATTERGCPQGGVKSGLIWDLVYDAQLEEFDKEENKKVTAKSFADDGTLMISGTNIEILYKTMQKALDVAHAWATECGLTYCPAKCNAMLFTTKRKIKELPKLKLNGQEIPQVKSARILGVIFDTKLTWKPHLNQKVDKCKATLMKIKPILNKHWSPNPILNRWVYTSVIIPILTYGSVIWERVTDLKGIRKKLEKLQRLGLTGIANTRRSTPTAALEHVYDIPPLHLQIKQKAQETFLRLGEIKQDEWSYPRIKKQGHLERLRSSIPNIRVDDTMTPRPNRNRTYKVVIDPKLKDYPETEGVIIFTDGSKSGSKTGAGVLFGEEKFNERLPDRTVFQAEVRAIQLACEHILFQDIRQSKITIHVDSQAALRALQAPYMKSKLVGNTIQLLNAIGLDNDLTLRWIKAHNDNETPNGNDIVDLIAKAGAKSRNWTSAKIHQPRSEIIRNIRNRIREEWTKEWENRQDCRQTKAFIGRPQPKIWKDIKDHGRETISRVIRFVSGHGYMNRHSTVIKYDISKEEADNHEEAQCRLCEEHEETPIHLITECGALIHERKDLFSESDLLAWMLDRPPDWTPAVIEFLNIQTIRDLDTRQQADEDE